MSFGTFAPRRFRPFLPVCLAFGGAAGLLTVAGCRHDSTPAAPTASVAVNSPVSPPPAPAFQPYTVLPQQPPAPAVVTHAHRNLHLIHTNNRVALADTSGRVYDVGRDASGHIYPIYRSPSDGRRYPLYYDSARDRYYRVARDDQGRYLRGYADDPANQYYAVDRDYERDTPSDSDRPIITNNYTNNYYENGAPYGSHGDQAAPAQHHGSHNNNWLWAIPVVAAAYFLLRPHHSSPPKPPYYPQRSAYVHTIPGRSITQINSNNRIVNNTHIVNQVNNFNYGGAGYPYPHGSFHPRPIAPSSGAFHNRHNGYDDRVPGRPPGIPSHGLWPPRLTPASHPAPAQHILPPRGFGKPAPPKQQHAAVTPDHPRLAPPVPKILRKPAARPLAVRRPGRPLPKPAPVRHIDPPIHHAVRPVVAKPFFKRITKPAAPIARSVAPIAKPAPAHLVKTIRRAEPPRPEPRAIPRPVEPARHEVARTEAKPAPRFEAPKREEPQHDSARPKPSGSRPGGPKLR
ncbi:hypothetical protein CCAX7_15560 [Capsulimonas corticalis]|uniref:Uncharacterized protein n=1 Tax=Capsulimonas corticalis TaxID=2219043 RepID=A0A402CZ64_9BACT|nr:hypothetical protein [Capsulimonas corticalis]BDI29505.1 hypothetical protein CCAX7_15560 [Capsulimonas corticalis]